MNSFTGIKDTDREILLRLSDKDLLKACSLNKYLFDSVCDDNFFHRKLLLSYPDTLFSYLLVIYGTYKRFYLQLVYYIAKLSEDFNYSYVSGKSYKQYQIFQQVSEKLPTGYVIDYNKLFIQAIRKKELNLVQEAVRNGIDVNEQALALAALLGSYEIVKYFVEQKGANIHANDEKALIYASTNGHLEVVKYLVEKGANISAENEDALKRASYNGHLDVVKYLVEKGANIDKAEALTYAAQAGQLEVVKYLVSVGANVHGHHDEPISLASRNRHVEVVKYLESLSNTTLL